jgi:HPr kinase/phosphorylase
MSGPAITVGGLLKSRPEAKGLPLELLSGAGGLDRVITSPHIQKTGLALAGFDEYLQPGRVLVFGESEVRFLDALEHEVRLQALEAVFTHDVPCVLITGGWEPPADLRHGAERASVPLMRTAVATPLAIAKLTAVLEDALAVREVIHGVLMDILGLGVLIVGDSGIGKSECALDLVVRGHRLVADDAVEIHRRGEKDVIGTCPELTRHHMEVRGLGVINIRDLFGVASTRVNKRLELVVQLERWDPPARLATGSRPDETSPKPLPKPDEVSPKAKAEAEKEADYDRLGLEDSYYELIGVRLPLVRMPVAPGRSVAILVEVAVRNQILRARGRHAARDLVARLERALKSGGDVETEPDEDMEHGGHV